MSIKNVALIGGTGTLGAPVLKALKSSPFTVYVLNRASSKSTYPNTKLITIPDDLNVDAIASAFQQHNIDALIITIAGRHVADQKKLIDAAFKGGVKRVMPAEFGSCDSADAKTNEVLPLMAGKKIVRDYLIETSQKERSSDTGNLTWTSLVTGHFFDYGLGTSLLKFDVKGRKAYLLDGGNIMFSGSNLHFIAQAVVRVLERLRDTENKILYVHSHHVTQLELLEVLEKVIGEKFERVEESSEEELKKWRPKMLDGDADAVEEVVAVWGVVAADWSGRDTFANGLLGLEEEDLEETVKRVVGK